MRRYITSQWDRVLAGGCVLLGGLALLLGWIGMSGSALSYVQLPYLISGGLVGVCLVGAGATVYLSADLRDEWRKLDSLEDKIDEALQRLEGAAPAEPVKAPARRSRPAERVS